MSSAVHSVAHGAHAARDAISGKGASLIKRLTPTYKYSAVGVFRALVFRAPSVMFYNPLCLLTWLRQCPLFALSLTLHIR